MTKDDLGGIYLFGPSLQGPTKVGMTKSIQERVNRLRPNKMRGPKVWVLYHFEMVEFQGSRHAYRYWANFPSRKIRSLELLIHKGLKPWKVDGEWFDLPTPIINSFLSGILGPEFGAVYDPLGEIEGQDDGAWEHNCSMAQADLQRSFGSLMKRFQAISKELREEACWVGRLEEEIAA